MKPKPSFNYIEWKSAEEMHYSSLQWLSELNFIKDEHIFFQDMLKEYTLPIIESKLFPQVKAQILALQNSETELFELHKQVTEHRNGLKIMVDGIDQPAEEKTYKQEHRELLNRFISFTEKFHHLKQEIFKNVSLALKKQKRLLN